MSGGKWIGDGCNKTIDYRVYLLGIQRVFFFSFFFFYCNYLSKKLSTIILQQDYNRIFNFKVTCAREQREI